MNYQLIPKELRTIAEKIEARQRLSEADALVLYSVNDLNALGMIANVVRERKNGNYATYIHNRYINYSNICILSCQFCAFAAKKRDAHAFEYAIDEIIRVVGDALPLGVTEVHMVGGMDPHPKGRMVFGSLAEAARTRFEPSHQGFYRDRGAAFGSADFPDANR